MRPAAPARSSQLLDLFVYGSLMRGQPNEGYLAGMPVRPARLPGRLFRLPAGYPVLVPDPSATAIQGELVRLPQAGLLSVLDHFEGVADGLYIRERVTVWVGEDRVPAWIYTQSAADVARRRLVRLHTDDWRRVAPPR
jgi:gamma-glutamylcyclotransferase (GGCT)/AIG2-like uncharacterized protein YtfP